MPKIGQAMPPPDTELASKAPTNGPVQAKDASAKTRPIIRVGKMPLPWVMRFREVIAPDGMVISNAPSRLAAKAKNIRAINRFTQTFAPSVCMPKGPRTTDTAAPRPVNKAMTPTTNTVACITEAFFSPDCVDMKYDIVIGIIGKTQGVKMANKPMPKARPAKRKRPWSAGEPEAGEPEEGASTAAMRSAAPATSEVAEAAMMPARSRTRSGISMAFIATSVAGAETAWAADALTGMTVESVLMGVRQTASSQTPYRIASFSGVCRGASEARSTSR